MIVYLIVTSIFVILTILTVIGLHAKRPDNIYLIVAREWQALIGTLLGFMILALTFFGQDYFEKSSQLRAKKSAERAYAKSIINDLDNIFKDQDTLLKTILNEEEDLFSQAQCNTNFDIHSIYTNWRFTIENNLSSLVSDLSPEGYILISETIQIKNRFLNTMGDITLEECFTNSKRIQKFLIGTHKTYGDMLRIQQSKLNQHLVGIR